MIWTQESQYFQDQELLMDKDMTQDCDSEPEALGRLFSIVYIFLFIKCKEDGTHFVTWARMESKHNVRDATFKKMVDVKPQQPGFHLKKDYRGS